MTRSRKASGKLTTKQLGQQVNEIQQVLNQLINAMSNDMARINGIVYALLQEDDRLEESNCPACGQALFEPKLKALPKATQCPACGHKFEEVGTQMTIENWDNGTHEEE